MSNEIKNREALSPSTNRDMMVEELGVDVVVDTTNANFIEVGAIGFGNTGSQNAALAYSEYGIPAVVINSSSRDLQTISDTIPKFLIGTGKGSGKDREVGREFFLNDAMNIIEEETIANLVNSCDVVSIIFSLGGGQGSSSGPILYNLLRGTYPDTKFIMQMVAPSNDDMLVGQQHAIDCMTEIKADTPDATYLLYDNSKFPELNTRDLYNKVNSNIARDLAVLRGDFIDMTDLDGIDEEELKGVCATPGRMAIGYLDDFSNYDINGSLPNTLKDMINRDSSHAVLEDDNVITSSALIYTVNSEDADLIGNIKSDVQTVFGTHIKDYRNENVSLIEDATNKACIILAGLSEPTTRIKAMLARKKEIERSVVQSRSSHASILDTSTVRSKKPDSILSKYTKAKPAETGAKKPSAADILNRYK